MRRTLQLETQLDDTLSIPLYSRLVKCVGIFSLINITRRVGGTHTQSFYGKCQTSLLADECFLIVGGSRMENGAFQPSTLPIVPSYTFIQSFPIVLSLVYRFIISWLNWFVGDKMITFCFRFSKLCQCSFVMVVVGKAKHGRRQ